MCWATRLVEQTPTPIAPDIDYAFFAVASQAPGLEALFANFILGRDHVDWYLGYGQGKANSGSRRLPRCRIHGQLSD